MDKESLLNEKFIISNSVLRLHTQITKDNIMFDEYDKFCCEIL